MNNKLKKFLTIALAAVVVVCAILYLTLPDDTPAQPQPSQTSQSEPQASQSQQEQLSSQSSQPADAILEDGRYTSKDDVALYLHTYGHLPDNYITKKDAEKLGWVSSKGNLWDVTDRMSIGGDSFGNREGKLPKASGRKWYECDIGYEGGYRGAARILYSSDGLIYYTDDHYESFTKLY